LSLKHSPIKVSKFYPSLQGAPFQNIELVIQYLTQSLEAHPLLDPTRSNLRYHIPKLFSLTVTSSNGRLLKILTTAYCRNRHDQQPGAFLILTNNNCIKEKDTHCTAPLHCTPTSTSDSFFWFVKATYYNTTNCYLNSIFFSLIFNVHIPLSV
jgi:hypothetical protein